MKILNVACVFVLLYSVYLVGVIKTLTMGWVMSALAITFPIIGFNIGMMELMDKVSQFLG